MTFYVVELHYEYEDDNCLGDYIHRSAICSSLPLAIELRDKIIQDVKKDINKEDFFDDELQFYVEIHSLEDGELIENKEILTNYSKKITAVLQPVLTEQLYKDNEDLR